MIDKERIVNIPKILELANQNKINVSHIEFIPGGKTNESYIVYDDKNEKYLARIAGVGTEKFIDRYKELYNIGIANEIGVSPKLLCACNNNLLIEYIDGECLADINILFKDNNLDKFTNQLRLLHESKKQFKGHFSFINDYKIYKNNFLSTGSIIPKELEKNEEMLYEIVRNVEDSFFDDLCPVHSDIVIQNVIFTNKRAYIVDWEYSTMASRYLDLASFCTQNLLNVEMTKLFINSYFNYSSTKFNYKKFILYKMSISFMWIYWHLSNVAHNKDKEYNNFRWKFHLNNALKCKYEWETIH